MIEHWKKDLNLMRRFIGFKRAQWRIDNAIQSAADICISGRGSLKTTYALADKVAVRFNMNPARTREMALNKVRLSGEELFRKDYPSNFI